MVLCFSFFFGGVGCLCVLELGQVRVCRGLRALRGEHGVLQPVASAQGVSACEGWISLLGFTPWKGVGEEFIR